MAVTPTTFKTRYPEFETEDDARVQIFIDDATLLSSSSFWGALYDLAVTYLAAHYLSIARKSEEDDGDAKAAGVIREKIDVLEVAYSDALIKEAANNPYKGTPYGQEYLSLLRRRPTVTAV